MKKSLVVIFILIFLLVFMAGCANNIPGATNPASPMLSVPPATPNIPTPSGLPYPNNTPGVSPGTTFAPGLT